jgi:group II intron reverse transcriptase/maturase
MSDLATCLSPDVVSRAYQAIKSDSAPWRHAPITARPSDRHSLTPYLQVVEQLRDGSYRPDAMRHHQIKKADGSPRQLSSLCKRDKFAQKLVQYGLEPTAEQLFHHDSFGYRPKRSVAMALARARERLRMGLHWLVDADIKSFFDRIPHRELMSSFKRLSRDSALNALIARWLAIGTYAEGFFDRARGIPQGSIVSPLLCNLYLHAFDEAMSAAGVPFVRYADDFLLFAPSERAAHQAMSLAARTLAKLALELKVEKTKIVNAEVGTVFLGEPLIASRKK